MLSNQELSRNFVGPYLHQLRIFLTSTILIYPFIVFFDNNINTFRSFEMDFLFNKEIIKKNRDYAIKYHIYWIKYGPK